MLLINDERSDKQKLLDILADSSIQPSAMVCLHYQEWQYPLMGNFKEIVDYVNERDIPLYIINGSSPDSKLLYDSTEIQFKKIQPIQSFPTYFLNHWTRNYLEAYKNFPTIPDHINIEHLLVSLNSRPHPHRCLLIDLMAKYDLIKDNAISWHSILGNNCDLNHSYHEFKYWTPEILKLDTVENYLNTGFGLSIPEQYPNSFVQVVSEATDWVKFITEKTTLPLFYGKIFIVGTTPGYHAYLKELGFELFEEIFDYEFDTIEDREQRFDKLVKNVSKLKSLTTQELESLYASVLPKLKHNQENLKKLVNSLDHWPELLIDLCEQQHPDIVKREVYQWYKEILSAA